MLDQSWNIYSQLHAIQPRRQGSMIKDPEFTVLRHHAIRPCGQLPATQTNLYAPSVSHKHRYISAPIKEYDCRICIKVCYKESYNKGDFVETGLLHNRHTDIQWDMYAA